MSGRWLLGVLGLVVIAACGDGQESGEFRFDVVVNNRSTDALEILVDGEVVQSSPTLELETRRFESYDQALTAPVRVETRRDQVTVASCDLYPGACRDACIPERETASICIDPDGTIGLNTWDCPCDDEVDDWFCGGDCALTAP